MTYTLEDVDPDIFIRNLEDAINFGVTTTQEFTSTWNVDEETLLKWLSGIGMPEQATQVEILRWLEAL